jgi:hypothetical protein
MPVVVSGAMCKCSCGTTPSSLVFLPKSPIFISGLTAGTIVDFISMLNIMPFGMCSIITNPVVATATAAATAAALGVFTLTPMPCVPAVSAPWIAINPKAMIMSIPLITHESQCVCMWGGSISIVSPGQFVVS